MIKEIYIRENNLNTEEIVYANGPGKIVQGISTSLSPQNTFLQRSLKVLKDVILPQGYPESVSDDYTAYQLWDTLQAFCSTITNTLSTRAILQSVGVGDEAVTSASAAITWIFKDGVGMVTKIAFAWITGTRLDGDCKKWRLFADVMNDIAVCTEIFLLPLLKTHALEILCVSTSIKGIVGVAGGATRAAITQHQARNNNTADVSAKDSSQETCVNLIASGLAIIFLKYCGESSFWHVFFMLTIMHLFANYKAVRVLNINTFNQGRLNIVIQEYLSIKSVSLPAKVNSDESVIPGCGLNSKSLCGYRIKMGCSIKELIKSEDVHPFELCMVTHVYKTRNYLVIVSKKCEIIYVLLNNNITCSELLEAYFHAIVQGIIASYLANKYLRLLEDDGKKASSYITEIIKKNNNYSKQKNEKFSNASMISHYVECLMQDQLDHKFVSLLQEKGWNIDVNHLPVGSWRASWEDYSMKVD